mgnify:CR=1 FL=1
MKIAVCLSGQPRVIETILPSLLNYFSGEDEYDFFCHSWNYNTYKRLKKNPIPGEWPVEWGDDEAVDEMHLQHVLNNLNPKKCVIEGKEVLGDRFGWDSLFYSMMYANHLKKQYEIEHNFRYDFVIKTRYDIVFYPGSPFKIHKSASPDNYLDAYFCHTSRMDYEYNRVNASDTIFYGSSTAMDILSDIYKDLYMQARIKRADDWSCLGPGTNLSEYAENRNMRLIPTEIHETVYRDEIVPMDPITHWNEVQEYNNLFYKVAV